MNCPNCNGNEFINGRCQYCGTQFGMDMASELDRCITPIYVSGNKISEILWADNKAVFINEGRSQ